MGKYLKAAVLVVLAAVPVVLVLMLTFGGEPIPDYDGVEYEVADSGELGEIGYGDYDAQADDADIDESQVTVLTLGGMWISHDILREVAIFNHFNEHYRIQVLDIHGPGGEIHLSPDESIILEQGSLRDIRDIDIFVYDPELGRQITFPMIDLYTLIDADPELSRTDFIPNILSSFEAPDGTLPFIAPGFFIETMISMREVAEQIIPLTFENMLRQLEQQPSPQPDTQWSSWWGVINLALHYSDNYFLNFEDGHANFYNDKFITVLELAAGMFNSVENVENVQTTGMLPWENRFIRGEIPLHHFILGDLDLFRTYQARLGDIVVVGLPTLTEGRHIIRHFNEIGINAESPHQEVAWNFVRRLLLQTGGSSGLHSEPNLMVTGIDVISGARGQLPIRVDLFEAHIERLMTPLIVGEVELPRLRRWTSPRPPFRFEPLHIYAMTEEEAELLREIVDSAFSGSSVDWSIIYPLILREMSSFLNGEHSAAEEARAIQERVQAFFDSRH